MTLIKISILEYTDSFQFIYALWVFTHILKYVKNKYSSIILTYFSN